MILDYGTLKVLSLPPMPREDRAERPRPRLNLAEVTGRYSGGRGWDTLWPRPKLSEGDWEELLLLGLDPDTLLPLDGDGVTAEGRRPLKAESLDRKPPATPRTADPPARKPRPTVPTLPVAEASRSPKWPAAAHEGCHALAALAVGGRVFAVSTTPRPEDLSRGCCRYSLPDGVSDTDRAAVILAGPRGEDWILGRTPALSRLGDDEARLRRLLCNDRAEWDRAEGRCTRLLHENKVAILRLAAALVRNGELNEEQIKTTTELEV